MTRNNLDNKQYKISVHLIKNDKNANNLKLSQKYTNIFIILFPLIKEVISSHDLKLRLQQDGYLCNYPIRLRILQDGLQKQQYLNRSIHY